MILNISVVPGMGAQIIRQGPYKDGTILPSDPFWVRHKAAGNSLLAEARQIDDSIPTNVVLTRIDCNARHCQAQYSYEEEGC